MLVEGRNFAEKINNLAKMGWIKSHRRGNTGIGKTIEDLLNLAENNYKIPDFGFAELKSHRKEANNLVTLFTLDKEKWEDDKAEIIKKFGYWDDKNQRQAFYLTVTSRENNHGLYVEVNCNELLLLHNSGETLGKWPIAELVEAFSNKMPNLVLVLAESRMNNDSEEFWYNEAYYLEGSSEEEFIRCLEQEIIVLDVRMHLKPSGTARNHGTGFRIKESDIPYLFASKVDILETNFDDYDLDRNNQNTIDDYF